MPRNRSPVAGADEDDSSFHSQPEAPVAKRRGARCRADDATSQARTGVNQRPVAKPRHLAGTKRKASILVRFGA